MKEDMVIMTFFAIKLIKRFLKLHIYIVFEYTQQ